jgi:hypothetical protein
MADNRAVVLEDTLRPLRVLSEGLGREGGVKSTFHLASNLPSTIRVDPAYLKQILVNLYTNALKHGQEVQVHVLQEGPELVFRIIDNGSGVPLALRDQGLFMYFLFDFLYFCFKMFFFLFVRSVYGLGDRWTRCGGGTGAPNFTRIGRSSLRVSDLYRSPGWQARGVF